MEVVQLFFFYRKNRDFHRKLTMAPPGFEKYLMWLQFRGLHSAGFLTVCGSRGKKKKNSVQMGPKKK